MEVALAISAATMIGGNRTDITRKAVPDKDINRTSGSPNDMMHPRILLRGLVLVRLSVVKFDGITMFIGSD